MFLLRPMMRAFGVFCLALGLTYGAIKIAGAPAKIIYIPPVVALIWLGVDTMLNSRNADRSDHQ